MRRRQELRRARAHIRLPVSMVVAQGLLSLSALFMVTNSALAQTAATQVSPASARPAHATTAKNVPQARARALAIRPGDCRAQAFRRGEQRMSYGTGSPRSRQLLNDCTPMGAPF